APRDVVARAISARKAWLDCRHLDHELLEREFFTVMRACRDNGIDPITELVPVAPAAHYSIGGIHTDLDGRSSIPRLYSIGECSNTGAHGANRLAGNSLAEALVFGRRAARAISGQRTGRVKGFPPAPEVRPAGTVQEKDWKDLRHLCTTSLGIERTPQGLARATDVLAQMAMLPLSNDPGLGEFRAAGIAARLLTRSATLRNESRGVHHRTDHPDPDPAWAGVRLRLARNQFQPHA
ncbi:MAG: L-aspartate oxidase, partial [Actinomycetota bacterium]|nr:L-aspartate oxidase [Actinomycetota bacterium]